MRSCSYILVVVVVLQDRAHLQGVGGSWGAAEGGSLLAQVGSLQQEDRTSATDGRKKVLLCTLTAMTVKDHQELLHYTMNLNLLLFRPCNFKHTVGYTRAGS